VKDEGFDEIPQECRRCVVFFHSFFKRNEQALSSGRVAVFSVAGGQGSQLDYDGPKGGFPGILLSKKWGYFT
jgi:hypothetical protein